MTFATDDKTKKALETFTSFDDDTQLALLWYGYLDIKGQLTPANATATQEVAGTLYHEIVALPQEDQLKVQREIVSGADTQVSHAYRALASSAKLDLWLRLAQGMEEGTIITVPDSYELPENTHEFVNEIKQLDFEQRLNFMRSLVQEMGAK